MSPNPNARDGLMTAIAIFVLTWTGTIVWAGTLPLPQ